MILYGAVLPTYNKKKNKDEKKQDEIKADDPNNKKKVRALIDNMV